MKKRQLLRYEMFVRVRNFGTANRDVFPESAPGGQKFAQLAAVVTSIEDHLVRREQARADARKVKVATRRAVTNYMKAIASNGRQATDEESPPHPFRMPGRRAVTVVLTTARLFMQEAERRKEKFVELGMPPTFLADFGSLMDGLEGAIGVQQDSRGARQKAQAGIEAGLSRGAKLIGQLDVTLANVLSTDPIRLGEWHGARRIYRRSSSSAGKTAAPAVPLNDSQTPQGVAPVSSPEHVLKIAS